MVVDVAGFLYSQFVASEEPTVLSVKDQRENCRQLYDLLLAGLEGYLEGTSHIVFVPDSYLFRVPFGCLIDSDGIYLIEKCSFSVSSSLFMMKKNSEQRDSLIAKKTHTSLVNGIVCESRSRMPTDEEYTAMTKWNKERQSFSLEFRSVFRRLVRSSSSFVALRDDEFSATTLEWLCSELHPRILHIVSHGSSTDPRSISDSYNADILYEFDLKGCLQCSNGPPLLAETVAEHFDLSGTDLVYLSCCSLGSGEQNDVGVLGFYRACFVAGCSSVICSLWPAVSLIATRVAVDFYHELGQGQLNKAESLQKAIVGPLKTRISGTQMVLRDQPIYWASIQLFGHYCE